MGGLKLRGANVVQSTQKFSEAFNRRIELKRLLLFALTICKLFLPARNQQNLASTILFASLKSSSATPIPLLSSSALSIGQITRKAFPSRVSRRAATLNIPLMSFGLCNLISSTLSIRTISPTLGKKSTSLNVNARH